MGMAEPMTALSDWIMGAIALGCAAVLRADPPQRSVMRWRMGFVATGVGSIAGGVYHALSLTASQTLLDVIWKLSTLSVGVASFFMLLATAASHLGGRGARLLTALAALQLALYAFWMLGHDDFLWVIIDFGSAMLCVAVLQAATCRLAPVASRWILMGIGVAAAGAAVQALGVRPHPKFNHNDLFHVIQMVSLVFLFRGARLARDRERSSTVSPSESRGSYEM